MKKKRSTLWLVLFTIVTIIFVTGRIHSSMRKRSVKSNLYHPKHHEIQHRRTNIEGSSKYTRTKEKAIKHLYMETLTLPEQLVHSDDTLDSFREISLDNNLGNIDKYVEQKSDDNVRRIGDIRLGDDLDNIANSIEQKEVDSARIFVDIARDNDHVNMDKYVEEEAYDTGRSFGEVSSDDDLGNIDKHIEQTADGNVKSIGELGIDICRGNIDTCVQQKADEITRTVGNLDSLWFKWLDKALLPDNGHMYASTQDRLNSRRIWTRASCRYMQKAGFTPPNQRTFEQEYTKHFIVNDKHRFLFCYLPKVANTNFRRVFLGLQGVVPKKRVPFISGYNVYFVHDDKFTYLRKFSRSEQHTLLNTYRKFMVIRDPYERLLSGYRNKFFHPNPDNTAEFHDKVTSFYDRHKLLLKRQGINVRTDFSQEALRFDEFLVYFVDTYAEGDYLNEHFTTSNQLCDPCRRSMDYIAKYDTLFDDVQHIFEKLNIDIEFPGRNDNYYTKETTSVETAYFSRIPTWLLLKVWHILKYDYVLYGFGLPSWFEERIRLEQSLGHI